ncbi:TlpA family protein disulfide reductase [Pedobacter deserti]|uniref:TlpA family protein disulfide reductase n=1 Tax=Pedobacter deserti TaxID=2817382 RepID=UPI00210EA8AA|nr:redoxin domain-containing protein [Pedobacter sp. SYSU D00382]
MKSTYLALTILWVASTAVTFAQSKLSVLKIGDTVPNITVKDFRALSGATNIREMSSKGGLIISFWATWCTPCLREMRLLDSLSTENKSRLRVISATYETEDAVNRFFRRNAAPQSASLLVVANDSTLHDHFPHRSIPHNIWIDKQGIVKAITGSDEITRANLSRFLSEGSSDLYQKDDDLAFDFLKPYRIADDEIGYRSQISGYNPRITSGVSYNPKTGGTTQRYFSWNTRIAELFWTAYTEQMTIRINWDLVELQTSDSVRFYHPRSNMAQFERSRYYSGDFAKDERKWNAENLYCYELILPRHTSNSVVAEYMFNDLQRFFNIKAEVRKRIKLCRLVFFGQTNITRADSLAASTIELQDGLLIVKNKTIEELLNYLYEWFGNKEPYINRSGVHHGINWEIKLPKLNGRQTYSENELWDALKKQGMTYKMRNRRYPVLVLRDLN